MTDDAAVDGTEEGTGNRRLSLLLAMAMFVLVVDTSLMNVSISKVVHDLGTTVSAVQSAIALEALISAAFILINSKVGDLIGRKRAYILGLLAYAIGALAMTVAQGITAIVIFWAIIGGLGASLLAAGDAVADPWQLRGGRAEEDLCARRSVGGDRRGGRAAPRGFPDDLPVLARRVPARGDRDRDHPVADQARQGRPLHGRPALRRRRSDPLGHRHGRRRARHPGLAGRRRLRRAADRARRAGAGGVRPLARAPAP